ncbi:MAG: cadherin-like domain-containing protein [Caldilineaceae bacterium]|nr:cadherin-like domain-containing protein [Caldilineaceae bacterium]
MIHFPLLQNPCWYRRLFSCLLFCLLFTSIFLILDSVWRGSVPLLAQEDATPYVDDEGHAEEPETPAYGIYPLPPVAIDDNYVITQTMVLTVAAPGVLANDATPEPAPLVAVFVDGPSHGDLLLKADGSFYYTPTVDFSGTDRFFYHAFDGSLYSGVTTVTIQVNPLPRLGDCNADQQVNAADLSAIVLEIFDGDGTARVDAGGGSFPGGATCDANDDDVINAADLNCTILLIFQGLGACEELSDGGAR